MQGVSIEGTVAQVISLLEEDPAFQARLIENFEGTLRESGISIARDQAAAFFGGASEHPLGPMGGATIRNLVARC